MALVGEAGPHRDPTDRPVAVEQHPAGFAQPQLQQILAQPDPAFGVEQMEQPGFAEEKPVGQFIRGQQRIFPHLFQQPGDPLVGGIYRQDARPLQIGPPHRFAQQGRNQADIAGQRLAAQLRQLPELLFQFRKTAVAARLPERPGHHHARRFPASRRNRQDHFDRPGVASFHERTVPVPQPRGNLPRIVAHTAGLPAGQPFYRRTEGFAVVIAGAQRQVRLRQQHRPVHFPPETDTGDSGEVVQLLQQFPQVFRRSYHKK